MSSPSPRRRTTQERKKMADAVPENSGALKRKLEEGETQTTKDEDLTSPPAKIRATDDTTSEAGTIKPNDLDVEHSAGSSNQTTTLDADGSGETYGEREKMQ